MKILKCQEPWFYVRLFDESEDGTFGVPLGCTNFGVIRKPVPSDLSLYVSQEINNACVLFSFSSVFCFVKIVAYYFKDKIIPSLKAKDKLKFAQYVTLNFVREKVQPWW